MRSKDHVSASRAQQRLLELCGKPANGAVQVFDTIDVGKEQGLVASDQAGTSTATDISVIWVPDATGQLQPYQLLPGVSATSSSNADTSCTHSTDTVSWQLQQLFLLQQQQQRRHIKVLQAKGEMQQSQQHKGLQETWQHSHKGLGTHLEHLQAPNPDLQQLVELQTAAAAAATAAARESAQHRCCKDCGATVALTWHWYKSSSSSKSDNKRNNISKQQYYVLCQVCFNHLRTTGCHRRFSVAPNVAAGPVVLAAALAAAAAAAAAADPRVPDGEQLRPEGFNTALTAAAADRKLNADREQLPTAEAATAAGSDSAAQVAALAAADPTANPDCGQQLAAQATAAAAAVNTAVTAIAEDPIGDSDSKQQLAVPATTAAAAVNAAVTAAAEDPAGSKQQLAVQATTAAAAAVNAAVTATAEAPTGSKQQLTVQSTAAAPTVQQNHQHIRGSAAGVGSFAPVGKFSLRSCSNCSRSLAVADCRRGQSACDQPEASQQQHVQRLQLCDPCQLYGYVAGAARPVSVEELSANQAGASQATAAWQGLQQWQQKLKQQQQEEEEHRVRPRGVKRPRSQVAAAAAGARKRAAGLSQATAQQLPKPSHGKKQQKQQQHKSFVAAAANGKLSNSTPAQTAKTPAAAAAGPAKGPAVAKARKVTGSKQPPKFKELKRNVFVHRQRVQLDSQDVVVCSCQPELGHCCSSEHGCLNHLCKVSCTPGHCPVGDDVCRNMVLFKRQFPSTKLVDLGHKGWGMVAAEDIRAGTIVAEYTGEVIIVSEGKKRLAQHAAEGLKHTYIMDLSKSEVIDATKKGGMARFINHSCEPNCKTEKWQVGGEVVVAIKATQHIPPGTEITYDYRYQSHDLPHARTRCCCGTASCTGWLGDFDPHEHLQAELDEDEIMEAERLAMSYRVVAVESGEELSE